MITSKLEGESCSPCDAGYRLHKLCTNTEDTVCRLCPPGTFQKLPGFKRECQRCSSCRRKERAVQSCTRVEDTLCECPENYVYSKYKPCRACPRGQIVVNNRCTNKTKISTPAPVVTNAQLSQDAIIALIGIGVALIILLVIIVFYLCYSRSKNKPKKQHKRNENIPILPKTTVVTSDRVIDIKSPDLRDKPIQTRKPNENVYDAIPTAPKRLGSDVLPFSLVYDMECMLASSHSKNYKHLAGQLGYTLTFIKQLEVDQHPVETLLGDWTTGEYPTKEVLHIALLAINRPDVAKKVMEEL